MDPDLLLFNALSAEIEIWPSNPSLPNQGGDCQYERVFCDKIFRAEHPEDYMFGRVCSLGLYTEYHRQNEL